MLSRDGLHREAFHVVTLSLYTPTSPVFVQSLQHDPRNEQHRGLLRDDTLTTRGKLNDSLGVLFTALPSSPCQLSRQTPVHTCISKEQQPSHEKDRPAGVSIKVGEEVCGPVGGAAAEGKASQKYWTLGMGASAPCVGMFV